MAPYPSPHPLPQSLEWGTEPGQVGVKDLVFRCPSKRGLGGECEGSHRCPGSSLAKHSQNFMAVKLRQVDEYRLGGAAEREDAHPGGGLCFPADGRQDPGGPESRAGSQRGHPVGDLGASLAMPDVHWGYGFPIGGVAAFDVDEGVVSPGGVGYDINCGVRLLRTNLERADAPSPCMTWSTPCLPTSPRGWGPGAGSGSSPCPPSRRRCCATAPPGP